MRKSTAHQIVSSLLEYGINPDAPRPGSPEDPWRKSGFKKLDFKDADFTGLRPGEVPPAEGEEEPTEPDATDEKPEIPRHDRFKWKPPESEEQQ